MAAIILSGRDVASAVKDDLRVRVKALADRGIVPGLAAILAGEHAESVSYVALKQRDCASVGIESFVHRLDAGARQEDLVKIIAECNADPRVHGILLQHPLPRSLDEQAAKRMLDPAKDIDGLTPLSVGNLVAGNPTMVAPTALGAMALIRAADQPLSGKRAVVIGRSDIVGKPAAWLLIQQDATVTVCHSKTRDLEKITREADVLVVAMGRPEFIKREHVKPGAIVVDCGYNRIEGRKGEVGDVDFAGVSEVAGWISPVPGGVGPAGRAMLIANCVLAAERTGRGPAG